MRIIEDTEEHRLFEYKTKVFIACYKSWAEEMARKHPSFSSKQSNYFFVKNNGAFFHVKPVDYHVMFVGDNGFTPGGKCWYAKICNASDFETSILADRISSLDEFKMLLNKIEKDIEKKEAEDEDA